MTDALAPHAAQDAADAFLQRLFDDVIFFAEEIWRDRRLDRVAPMGDVEREIIAFAAGGEYDPERRSLSNGTLTGWIPPTYHVTARQLSGAAGLNKFRGILAPRRTGKTHLVTAVLTLWRLFRDVARRILIISKSHTEAKKTVKLIRDWIDDVWFLKHLKPDTTRNQRDNRDMFDVGPAPANRQASVTAIGIEGQLEGNRAHSIIPDDIETKGNTETLEARTKLNEVVTEFKFILYGELPTDSADDVDHIIDPTEIVYVGTYHHEESLYLKLADRGYIFRTWPLLYPGPSEEVLNLSPILAARMAAGLASPGDITMPHRFDRLAVAEFQAEGRRAFSMQCMLLKNLAAGDLYPLRLADLMVMDLDPVRAPQTLSWGTRDHNGSTALSIPTVGFSNDNLHRPVFIDKDWLPYTGTKLWIDSSGRGADDNGVAIVSHLNGYLFVRYCDEHPGGYSTEALDFLASLALRFNAREVYVESNFGGGAIAELLEPRLQRLFLQPGVDSRFPEGWAASIITDTKITHAVGQKEIRIINMLEPVTSSHRMIWDTSVAQNTKLQHQYTRITRQRNALGRSPNSLDALAGCVKAWQHTLRLDPEVNKRRLDAELELKEHLDNLRDQEIDVGDPDRIFNHRGFTSGNTSQSR